MKTILISLLLISTSLTAKADIFRCTFTEPFFALQYSTTTRVLSVTGPDLNKSQSNVSFQIKGPRRFDLYSSTHQTLAILQLNNRGSDGMSDKIYPYSMRLSASGLVPGVQIGGCESNFLRAIMPGYPAEAALDPETVQEVPSVSSILEK